MIPLFAVSIHKGGVDYDDINKLMAPDDRAMAELTVKQLENWDNELQQNEVEDDAYDLEDSFRSNAITKARKS